jgi:hypothetical protein
VSASGAERPDAIEVQRADQVAEVIEAWAALVAFNPDARTLGGELSHRTWAALDALTEGDRS